MNERQNNKQSSPHATAPRSAADIYELNPEIYSRFKEQDHCIYRALYDPDFEHYHKTIRTGMEDWVNSGVSGFSRADLAFAAASWTINKHMPFAYEQNPEHSFQDYFPPSLREKVPSLSEKLTPSKLSKYVKVAAKKFGASLVGITEVDRRWLYSTKVTYSTSIHEKETNPFPKATLDEDYKYAIVMAIEMEPSGFQCAPTFLEFAAAGWGYSQMSVVIASLAQFIRFMGFKAIPCANDTGLSIPMAIDAGLGALGRIGLLVTKEFGPRVRLCKVLTNAPLEPDVPDVRFIDKITKICESCRICSDSCEMEAIDSNTLRSYDVKNRSNNPGVKKWYIDGEKCYGGWIKYSTDCGKCIAACPFSRIGEAITSEEFWNL